MTVRPLYKEHHARTHKYGTAAILALALTLGLALILAGCTTQPQASTSSPDSNAHFQYKEGIELTDELKKIAEDIEYGNSEGEGSLAALESSDTLSEDAYWCLVPALEAKQYLETKYPGTSFCVSDSYTAYNGQTNTYQQGRTIKLELMEDPDGGAMSSGTYTVTVDWGEDAAHPVWSEDYYLDYCADEYDSYVTSLISEALTSTEFEAAAYASVYSPSMVGDDLGPSTNIETFAKDSVCDLEIYIRESETLNEDTYNQLVSKITDSLESTGISAIWSSYCITRLDTTEEFNAQVGYSAARTGDADPVDALQPGHKWYLHGYVGLENAE